MPAGAAASAEADSTRRQVKVVMDNNEGIGADFKLIYQPTYRLAAEVHMSLGPGDYYLAAGDLTGAGAGLALFFIQAYALRPGEVPQAHEADVMAVMGVSPPRVTQTND